MIDASLYFFWPDGMMKHTWIGESEFQGPALYDLYRLWETADGHLIYFTATDSEFHGLFRALGHPEWVTDPRFGTIPARALPENREALGALLLRRDPQVEDRGADRAHGGGAGAGRPGLHARGDARRPAAPPQRVVLRDGAPGGRGACASRGRRRASRRRARRPAASRPLHGEHTEEVLAELGYDATAIAALRAEGVIP